jgi:membrane protein implicated in regulation of membrane protease activity
MDAFTIFHFYLIFFLLGMGYAVVAVLLGQMVGGHGDGHGEVAGSHGGGHAGATHSPGGEHSAGHSLGGDVGGESMPTISPLSPVTIATFATAFGGTGMVLDRIGLPGFLSVLGATAGGGMTAAAVFYLFYRVFRVTQSTSGVSARQAIGREAEVIVTIPEKGVGEIAYVLGGRRFNAPARTEDGSGLHSRSRVVIVGRTGALLVVRACAKP